MEVVPVEVDQVVRAWDEQHLDLAAAARRLAGFPTSGFTAEVAGPAARFAATWQRHLAGLAAEAEARADGLRATLADLLATDEAVGGHLRLLQAQLQDPRR